MERMIPPHRWLEWAKELRAMAETGLTYSKDYYEIERCKRMEEIAHAMIADYFERPLEDVVKYFDQDRTYPTPKIDVRVAIFKENAILLVKEKSDGKWTLPGGWCDIGTSPSESARLEVAQEAGFLVHITRLLAIHDKAKHPHPPHPDYTYKIFFEAEIIGTCETNFDETDGVNYFELENLPPLSLPRILPEQLEMVLRLHKNGEKVEFD